MISAIDYLDIDISDLLGKYIDTRKKNNIVLHDLKDNIIFTTHINYYKKNFQSSRHSDMYHDNTFPNESKHKTLTDIKKFMHQSGWIVNYPTKFSWGINKLSKQKNIEKHRKNFRMIDKVTNWQYVSYPPHSRHYNSRDLIKHIKIK